MSPFLDTHPVALLKKENAEGGHEKTQSQMSITDFRG